MRGGVDPGGERAALAPVHRQHEDRGAGGAGSRFGGAVVVGAVVDHEHLVGHRRQGRTVAPTRSARR